MHVTSTCQHRRHARHRSFAAMWMFAFAAAGGLAHAAGFDEKLKAPMMTRLRLRRFCSLSSGIYCARRIVRYSDCRTVSSAVPAMRVTNEFSPFSAASAWTRT